MLGREDSGVSWRGAGARASSGGGRAVLSGGVDVGPWAPAQPSNASSPLVAPWPRAAAAAGAQQLFVLGARATVTWDNASQWGLGRGEARAGADGFTTDSALPRAWPAPASVELIFQRNWQQNRCNVAGVEALANGSTLVRVAQPCWAFGASVGQLPGPPGAPTWVANAAAPTALAPGAWTLSADGASVFYAPRSTAERAALLAGGAGVAVAPALPLLLAVHGAEALGFADIDFAFAGWPGPTAASGGFIERYGGVLYVECESGGGGGGGGGNATLPPCVQQDPPFALAMTPAAVQVTASRGVTFTGCGFLHLGGTALGLYNGTAESGVSGGAFSDLSGGAVFLGNVNETQSEDPAEQARGLFVEDLTFEGFGAQFQGAVAITLFAATDSSIVHNAIGPGPYSGISFGWPVPQNQTFSRNNSLVGNSVRGACRVGTDGGSVHTIGPMPGALIAENFLANDSHGHAALYIDNTSADFMCLRNVIDSSHYWFWIQQSGGHNAS